MSTSNWIWSDQYKDYYYVTYDEYNNPVYHWSKQTETRARQDSRPSPDYESNVVRMPDLAPPENFRSLRGTIQGTPQTGWYDILDSSYRMRMSPEAQSFFVVGRVFAMLYSETASETPSGALFDYAYTIVRPSERVHTSIRRFVVVQDCYGFVYACGIGTYSGRGALRQGYLPAEYAIAYPSGTDPESCYLPGERTGGMTKEPIEIVPADASVDIRPESRIWFGKTYPIEKNVKVKDVGRVRPNHISRLLQYWAGLGQEEPGRILQDWQSRQDKGKARDRESFQIKRGISDDGSIQDEENIQKKRSTQESGRVRNEEERRKETVMGIEGKIQESDLLDKEDVRHKGIDDKPPSPAPRSNSKHDEEVLISTDAGMRTLDVSAKLAADKLHPASRDIMTRSNSQSAKIDSTGSDNSTSRWSQDIDYRLNGHLHSDYTVINNPRAFFKKGKVFMVPWPELSGHFVKGQVGPPVMVKVRRLVVVRPKATFCLCLPMHTYSGQATSKAGVNAQDHAPVVPEGGEVVYHENEAELTKSPMYIKVEKPPTGPISPMSRLNFAKVYTVEYNVKVRPIGRLIPDSVWRMDEYFMECLAPNTS